MSMAIEDQAQLANYWLELSRVEAPITVSLESQLRLSIARNIIATLGSVLGIDEIPGKGEAA